MSDKLPDINVTITVENDADGTWRVTARCDQAVVKVIENIIVKTIEKKYRNDDGVRLMPPRREP